MSKLNPPATHPRKNAAVSANGNLQDLKSDKQQLIELLSTCLYGKGDAFATDTARMAQLRSIIRKLVVGGQHNFIANAIVFARTQMNIRTFPVIAAVEFANELRGAGMSYVHMRKVVSGVIHRADQITDLMAYAISVFTNKKAIPKAILRGVEDAFNKFNAYQFAKYNRAGGVKFTDALRIVHPTPKDDAQAVIFDQLMNETRPVPSANGLLPAADTWENRSSAAGTTGQSKQQVWDGLIAEDKLGYTAILMNIRNMVEFCSPESLDTLAKRIREPKRVERSRVLPFQILQAISYAESVPVLKRALNDALELSLANVGALAEKIWLLVDSSGSMSSSQYSGNKSFVAADIAAIFTAAIARSAARDPELSAKFKMAVTLFDSKARNITLDIDKPLNALFTYVRKLMTGGSTDLQAGLDQYKKLGFVPDVIVIISDMQVNRMGRNSVNLPGTRIALNVCAESSTPVSDIQGWKQVSGFSSNVLDIIKHGVAGNDYMDLFEQPFTGKFELTTDQHLQLLAVSNDSE